MKAADSAMWEGCISVVVKEQRCDRWPKCTDKQMGMLWIFWGSMSCKASSAQVMTPEPLCEARVTSSISKILSLSRVQVLQNWDQREKTNYWTVIGAELNKHGREVKNWMERKDKTGVYFTESMNHNHTKPHYLLSCHWIPKCAAIPSLLLLVFMHTGDLCTPLSILFSRLKSSSSPIIFVTFCWTQFRLLCLSWRLRLLLSRGRTWHFPLLNFTRLLPAQLCSMLRSLWMVSISSTPTGMAAK